MILIITTTAFGYLMLAPTYHVGFPDRIEAYRPRILEPLPGSGAYFNLSGSTGQPQVVSGAHYRPVGSDEVYRNLSSVEYKSKALGRLILVFKLDMQGKSIIEAYPKDERIGPSKVTFDLPSDVAGKIQAAVTGHLNALNRQYYESTLSDSLVVELVIHLANGETRDYRFQDVFHSLVYELNMIIADDIVHRMKLYDWIVDGTK